MWRSREVVELGFELFSLILWYIFFIIFYCCLEFIDLEVFKILYII